MSPRARKRLGLADEHTKNVRPDSFGEPKPAPHGVSRLTKQERDTYDALRATALGRSIELSLADFTRVAVRAEARDYVEGGEDADARPLDRAALRYAYELLVSERDVGQDAVEPVVYNEVLAVLERHINALAK